jgi:hypothetical protein
MPKAPAASSDPSPEGGRGIPVAMPTSQDQSAVNERLGGYSAKPEFLPATSAFIAAKSVWRLLFTDHCVDSRHMVLRSACLGVRRLGESAVTS